MNSVKKILLAVLGASLLCIIVIFAMRDILPDNEPRSVVLCPKPEQKTWEIQSIDTMKYSRDHARKRMSDAAFMEKTVPQQVKAIAQTGATHIAINTPYDKEFLPMLTRWVYVAREHDLNVLFRGNWSGWEGWFEYPKDLTRREHIEKTSAFISDNRELFKDGDIFSACPECENGGPGDPRHNGDVKGHRKFLIDEYDAMRLEFEKIGKDVAINNFSMNGDVARLVMDRQTTEKLGGVVTIDHYVKTPEQLAKDIDDFAMKSGGKIFIGELGIPLSSLHGNMTEEQQTDWLKKILGLLENNENVIGINYWVSVGGSTALWNDNGVPRSAVGSLTKYFKPDVVYGKVIDELDYPIEGALIHRNDTQFITDSNGCFSSKFVDENNESSGSEKIKISYAGFEDVELVSNDTQGHTIVLKRENKTRKFKLQLKIKEWQERKSDGFDLFPF